MNEIRFETADLVVAALNLQRVPLKPVGSSPGVRLEDAEIVFTAPGWYEVLLTVKWDPANREGRRFAHTAIPDSHPLHSEAIEADVLADLSNGCQLLRGNTFFDPESSVRSLALEVWQDSPGPTAVTKASIVLRPLPAPSGS